MAARGRQVGERLGTLAAKRQPHRVGRLALGTLHLPGHLPALQVGFDLAAGKVAVVDVFRKTTRQTPKHVIDNCRERLRAFDERERQAKKES